MMRHTVVNPKGRVTIPFELRKRFEITRVNRERRARPICDVAPMTLHRRNEIRRIPHAQTRPAVRI
jgi:hypothetical protein